MFLTDAEIEMLRAVLHRYDAEKKSTKRAKTSKKDRQHMIAVKMSKTLGAKFLEFNDLK